jgi:beta-glucosidase
VSQFLFATGIEGSDPTIDQGKTRHDQYESCRFYENWKTDWENLKYIGVTALRYGPSLHKSWAGPGHYDWSFFEETYRALPPGIELIVDLCHFGLPDWLRDFQNPDFPHHFSQYALDFARRFPGIKYYTPVNEMLICAMFSARFGWWNEQAKDDVAFVRALKHLVMANRTAMSSIMRVREDAVFVQAEAHEYSHAECEKVTERALRKNEERFLSLDLNYGHPVTLDTLRWLYEHGMDRDEYLWFMNTDVPPEQLVIGHDYYVTSESFVHSEGEHSFADDVAGFAELARQYHRRYGLVAMHTETNMHQGEGDEAVRWLRKQWRQLQFARREHGIPVIGFTWYSLTDQTDWDVALREKRGRVNPLGLYDLDRNIRPVGRAYKELIQKRG